MLDQTRRDRFKADVAAMKLKSRGVRRDGLWRVAGVLLMLGGAIAAFLVYESSLSMSDPRNIESAQILAIACLAVTVLGAALYLAAAIASVLRVWLLRQLYEGQQHVDQLAEALTSAKR